MSNLIVDHIFRDQLTYDSRMQTLPDVQKGFSPAAFGRLLQETARESVVIDVSNVADYFFKFQLQDKWIWDTDFRMVAPPFESFWMEYTAPAQVLIDGELKPWGDHADYNGIGALFTAIRIEEGMDRDRFKFAEQFCYNESMLDECLRQCPGGWLMAARVVPHIKGKPPRLLEWMYFFMISAEGVLLGNPLMGFPSKLLHEHIKSASGTVMIPFLLATSFMHCKNVARVENDGAYPSRQARREAERKNFPKPAAFYTLQIEPMKKVLATEGGIAQNGLKKALHICRGHFSEYSEEKPLFGKYAGRFWIPAHVRGSAEIGLVGKDYAVNAPRKQDAA